MRAHVGSQMTFLKRLTTAAGISAALFVATQIAAAHDIAEVGAKSSVIWGAVGHNDRPRDRTYPYNRIPLERQISLLADAGLKGYRAGCDDMSCPRLIKLLSDRGMIYLRSLEQRPNDKISAEDNYKRGYQYGFQEARKYAGKIRYYEASNELDNWTKMAGDGGTRIQFNAARFAQAREYLKGLIEGIHAADKQARVMVDDAGWCHYGFLQALWADGVRWDITAFHWYSDQGNVEKAGCRSANVAAIHAQFGVPVWITEFNKNKSKDHDETISAQWVGSFIQQINRIAHRYKIQAAFVYELLEEPTLKHSGEQYYGIVDSNGVPKPTWNTMRRILIKGSASDSLKQR